MTAAVAPLDPAALQQAVSAADPNALIVSRRVMRRALRRLRERGDRDGPRTRHQDWHFIDRDTLSKVIPTPDAGTTGTAILLVEPRRDTPPRVALLALWRSLFHAHVHLALEGKLADGQLTADWVRRRIDRIGTTEFDEIRAVLREEHGLPASADSAAVYVEFAATYLELRHFDHEHLHAYFPAITDPSAIDAILGEDVPSAELLLRTRPQGADLPGSGHLAESIERSGQPATSAAPLTGEAAREVRVWAENEAARGNLVRAALLHARAEGGSEAARGALDLLVGRLQKALELTDEQAGGLRGQLPELLPRAAPGMWTVEARLLFDLQKVCVDSERGVYELRPMGWLLSLGRRPFKRPLPCQRQVMLLRNLRRAVRKALRVHLPPETQGNLTLLLETTLEHYAARLRDRLRPLVAGAFDEVGLVPANLPERVARDKVVEELIDRICDNYHLTFGDVRDALARNQLKMDDLGGPGEWLGGDPLLKLNVRLAEVLDGAYRKGEFYLRGFQRLSAAAFGTRPGRLLTRYLAVPFGGAFMLLSFAEYLTEEFGRKVELAPPWSQASRETVLTFVLMLAGLGTFLLLLLHVPPFRRRVAQGARLGGRALRGTLIGAPLWAVRRPLVLATLRSAPVRLFRGYLLEPLLLAGVGALVAWLSNADAVTAWWCAGIAFVVGLALCHFRPGRELLEATADQITHLFERIRTDFIPALLRAVAAFFKALMEGVEWVLYGVDERLRFRTGDSRAALVLKAAAGSLWSGFAYFIRFCLVLLVEPQINPIKHFPTVTVSHKLLLPLIYPLAELFNPEAPLKAVPTAALLIWCIPGIFGFLVWEFKENWRLYKANRPAALRPVRVGGHGETVLRLLRPGFHSGTLPKLFRKMRKAARSADRAAVTKRHLDLHHVEEAVRRFVERELLHLLDLSSAWARFPISLKDVIMTTNRIALGLAGGQDGGAVVWLSLEYRDRRLVAEVDEPGWLEELTEPRRQAILLALAGWCKLAGVDATAGLLWLSEAPLPWALWVEEWQRDQAGEAPRTEFQEGPVARFVHVSRS